MYNKTKTSCKFKCVTMDCHTTKKISKLLIFFPRYFAAINIRELISGKLISEKFILKEKKSEYNALNYFCVNEEIFNP